MIRRIPLVLLLLFALPRLAGAQVVRGSLIDVDTKKPLPGATMTLLTADSARQSSVVTDSAGKFVLVVQKPGGFRLQAQLSRFQAATSPVFHLGAADTLTVEFSLSSRVVVLDPLVVKARSHTGQLGAFYERARESAFGNFLTRDQIEKQHVQNATDLLSLFPGIQLAPRGLGGGSWVVMRGNCTPAVFLDGNRVHLFGDTIDDIINPMDLEGVEIYRSAAEAPVQYTLQTGGCGVILLWTRLG